MQKKLYYQLLKYSPEGQLLCKHKIKKQAETSQAH